MAKEPRSRLRRRVDDGDDHDHDEHSHEIHHHPDFDCANNNGDDRPPWRRRTRHRRCRNRRRKMGGSARTKRLLLVATLSFWGFSVLLQPPSSPWSPSSSHVAVAAGAVDLVDVMDTASVVIAPEDPQAPKDPDAPTADDIAVEETYTYSYTYTDTFFLTPDGSGTGSAAVSATGTVDTATNAAPTDADVADTAPDTTVDNMIDDAPPSVVKVDLSSHKHDETDDGDNVVVDHVDEVGPATTITNTTTNTTTNKNNSTSTIQQRQHQQQQQEVVAKFDPNREDNLLEKAESAAVSVDEISENSDEILTSNDNITVTDTITEEEKEEEVPPTAPPLPQQERKVVDTDDSESMKEPVETIDHGTINMTTTTTAGEDHDKDSDGTNRQQRTNTTFDLDEGPTENADDFTVNSTNAKTNVASPPTNDEDTDTVAAAAAPKGSLASFFENAKKKPQDGSGGSSDFHAQQQQRQTIQQQQMQSHRPSVTTNTASASAAAAKPQTNNKSASKTTTMGSSSTGDATSTASVAHPDYTGEPWGRYRSIRRIPDLELLFLVFQDAALGHRERNDGDGAGGGGGFDDQLRSMQRDHRYDASVIQGFQKGGNEMVCEGEDCHQEPRHHETHIHFASDADIVDGRDHDGNAFDLDDLDKFFEPVDPQFVDVGASGLSMQEVLMGQGRRIIFKKVQLAVRVSRRAVLLLRDRAIRQWKKVRGSAQGNALNNDTSNIENQSGSTHTTMSSVDKSRVVLADLKRKGLVVWKTGQDWLERVVDWVDDLFDGAKDDFDVDLNGDFGDLDLSKFPNLAAGNGGGVMR